MKKINIIILIFCSLLITSCSKGLYDEKIKVDIGSSDLFTKEEITTAVNEVKKNFNFPAATLKNIYYNDEKSREVVKNFLESNGDKSDYEPEDIIGILSDFYVDDSGDNPVLNPDSTYEDYIWILGRENSKADWTILDFGY